jgi:hypothetical protein
MIEITVQIVQGLGVNRLIRLTTTRRINLNQSEKPWVGEENA